MNHADPQAVDHACVTGVVLRERNLESVLVEVEQAVDGRPPTIVLSVFTQKTLEAMNADLTVEEARRAHAALAEALRLVGEPAQ